MNHNGLHDKLKYGSIKKNMKFICPINKLVQKNSPKVYQLPTYKG